jgi:uncharacterized coiled-coil DUF342 family protein
MQTVEFARTGDSMADLDQKIDELRAEMREGFKEVRTEFKNVRSEVNGVRSEVKDLRDEMHAGFKDVRSESHAEVVELRADLGTRFGALERSITALWVSLSGGLAAFVAALIVTNS